jgi:FKBP-type peptidyl-prolyl cis-trans isomerase FklB
MFVGLVLLGLAACQPDAATNSSDTGKKDAAADAANDALDSAADGANSMFDTDEKKASYAMGFGVTRQVTGQFSEAIDHDAFVAGARAQLEGKESEVSQEDAQRALTALNEAQQAKQALVATGTAKEGAKFLADNAGKEGVVTTASGLQYLVLTEGTGPKPKATDTVKTHYEGTLINGEVFDSSVERGQPATFPLDRVIRGWTEALQLMNTGSKYRLFIPPELAYGNQATGSIPPQSTLIFEVELLEIMGGDAS